MSTKNSYGGVGFVGLLQLIFITLKLIGLIDWPWWAVLLPVAFQFGVFAIAIVIAGYIAMRDR